MDEKHGINITITGDTLANEGLTSDVGDFLYWIAIMMGVETFSIDPKSGDAIRNGPLIIRNKQYPFETLSPEICLSVLTFAIAQSSNCEYCKDPRFGYGRCRFVRFRPIRETSWTVVSVCFECSMRVAATYLDRFSLIGDVYVQEGIVTAYGNYNPGGDYRERTIGKRLSAIKPPVNLPKEVGVPKVKAKGPHAVSKIINDLGAPSRPRLSRAAQKRRKRKK
jgi:hypothetical protein